MKAPLSQLIYALAIMLDDILHTADFLEIFHSSANCCHFVQEQNDERFSTEKEISENTKVSVQCEKPRKLFSYVAIPSHVAEAAKNLLEDREKKLILLNSQKLCQILYSRRLPIEFKEYYFILETLNRRLENADLTEVNHIEKTVQSKLKQEICRWKPVIYDECKSKAYMVGRLGANYAALSTVFKEVKANIPSFQPQSFFDYGSGIGTSVWAAYQEWGNTLYEYFCIDESKQMNELAELLLKDGMKESTDFLKKVYFRQFLPESNKAKFDLVVCAYSLMELPSMKDRLKVIDILWKKTEDILVLIESGSWAGFTTILDARDYILQIERKGLEEHSSHSIMAHVVAPCPHDVSCPRFGNAFKYPCNFKVHYPTIFQHPQRIRRETFSYVVLQKRARASGESWPRVVSEIKKRSKVVQCSLCCSDGKFRNMAFTKRVHGSHIYKCVKRSKYGNLLPFPLSDLPKRDEYQYKCESTLRVTQKCNNGT